MKVKSFCGRVPASVALKSLLKVAYLAVENRTRKALVSLTRRVQPCLSMVRFNIGEAAVGAN